MSILVVCEGNVCRSPYVEYRLRQQTRWPVASAGTAALEGHAMEKRVAREVTKRGGDPAGFVARALSPELLAGAHLVLTATRDQRSVAVQTYPKAMNHTFTLADFSGLAAAALAAGRTDVPLDASPDETLTQLVRVAREQRPFVTPLSAEAAALPDPWQREGGVHATMIRRAEAWLGPVVALLNA